MRRISLLLATALLLTACVRDAPDNLNWTPASPFVPVTGATRPAGVPTQSPLQFTPPAGRAPGTPIASPTPDPARGASVTTGGPREYVVQPGDTLGHIAQAFGVSVEAIAAANNLLNPNILDVGQLLIIPTPEPGAAGSSFKIIPDSELVYGPASATLDLAAFVRSQGGYLAGYGQSIEGEYLSGDQIVLRVAQDYSVNPRLLLALLEYESGWVSNPAPANLDFPMNHFSARHAGLYRQLAWAANELNRAFYAWRTAPATAWLLADGGLVPADPTINAGTAAVQSLLARLHDRAGWEQAVTLNGLFRTYFFMFGYPFDLAVEPLVPPGLTQPALQLPFAAGEVWAFTGGPHGAWDDGSPWAALDFAPPGEPAGCTPSDAWVLAAADGWIVRAANGSVVQDLSGDGYEQTGWALLYMHIETRDRVRPGSYVRAGERIGHPSCEGGVSNGTHVHLARKYNGVWIAAEGPPVFVLDGWAARAAAIEYDGYLVRGDQTVEAWDGLNDLNRITR